MDNNHITNSDKGIIEKIYNLNNEEIDNILKLKQKEIKLKEIDYKIIEKIEKNDIKEKIKEIIKIQDENYNIKLSEYSKAMYKKGFKDGINIIIEALH